MDGIAWARRPAAERDAGEPGARAAGWQPASSSGRADDAPRAGDQLQRLRRLSMSGPGPAPTPRRSGRQKMQLYRGPVDAARRHAAQAADAPAPIPAAVAAAQPRLQPRPQLRAQPDPAAPAPRDGRAARPRDAGGQGSSNGDAAGAPAGALAGPRQGPPSPLRQERPAPQGAPVSARVQLLEEFIRLEQQRRSCNALRQRAAAAKLQREQGEQESAPPTPRAGPDGAAASAASGAPQLGTQARLQQWLTMERASLSESRPAAASTQRPLQPRRAEEQPPFKVHAEKAPAAQQEPWHGPEAPHSLLQPATPQHASHDEPCHVTAGSNCSSTLAGDDDLLSAAGLGGGGACLVCSAPVAAGGLCSPCLEVLPSVVGAHPDIVAWIVAARKQQTP
jgi:hypothetical protein